MKKASDANLDFDGMTGNGVNRSANRFAGNQHTKTNSDALINKGRGPTKGNQDFRTQGGPSATKDAYRAAPTAGVPSTTKTKNPDYINGGAQVRTPGGTRSWEPSAGQNYRGNADRINVSGYSMGDGKVSRGGKPATKAGDPNFNYGPKSQY
jgi:hypothetical protein